MKSLLPFLLLGCLACTDNSNKNQAMDQYVNKEIRDRIARIKSMNASMDTVLIDADAVEKKIGELILLSKDIENPGASVKLSNDYLDQLIKTYHLNQSDFKKIHAGMHVDDIASVLKQDEMALFNHILLQTGQDGAVPLHAAQ